MATVHVLEPKGLTIFLRWEMNNVSLSSTFTIAAGKEQVNILNNYLNKLFV